MFILKKGHQPGVYVPLRALFLVFTKTLCLNTLGMITPSSHIILTLD